MKRIKSTVFSASVYIYGPDEKEKYCKDYDVTMPKTLDGNNCGNGIWIGKVDAETIAHEATHAALFVMTKLIEWEENALITGHTLPYMIGWIAGEATKYLEKK